MPDPSLSAPVRRVLMSCDAVGGVWTYAAELAGALERHGVATTLAGFGPEPTRAQLATVRGIAGLDVVWTPAPLAWMAEHEDDLAAVTETLDRLAVSSGADVLHLNLAAEADGLRTATPRVVVCHSCLATWWDAAGHGPMPDSWVWKVARDWRGLARAQAIVAPTAAHAAATERVHGLDAGTVHVVANARSAPAEGGDPADKDPLIVGAARWWDPAKDMGTLDAAASVAPWRVVLAGALAAPDGSTVAARHAHAIGRTEASTVRALMGRAAIFASAALYEPFGLAALEAAQAGCALVLADIQTHRELWDDAALFVPPGDAEGFAAAFTALAADERLCAGLGRLAASRAAAFDPDIQAREMMAIYDAVATRRSPAAAE